MGLCYNPRAGRIPLGHVHIMSMSDRLVGTQERHPVRGLLLSRPLAVFDVETTGVSSSVDRIIEITIIRVELDGSETVLRLRLNPEVPIPPEATAVNGITDEDVAGKPTFAAVAAEIYTFLEGCDLAGFNIIKFDLPLLEAEFARAGVQFSREDRAVVDAMTIFHEKEPRNLAGAARFYLQREMPEFHTSETDARATLDILSAQVQRYPDVPEDVSALHAYCNPVNPDAIDPEGKFESMNGRPSIAFGKHKGRSLQELATEPEPNYLHWILDGDFSREVKEIVHAALRGEFPSRDDTGSPKEET